MKILLITSEEWNDVVYGNNILTNWFADFDAEFAQIYCSPGLPNNSICNLFFQITDSQMLKSLFSKYTAGKEISQDKNDKYANVNAQRQGIYRYMKNISMIFNTLLQLVRDFIWIKGRYDIDALRSFVSTFNPDIVYCPRFVSPKLMRLETIVSKMTDAPFVAFTADNEVSLNCYSWSPLFWLRRLYVNQMFRKHVKLYKHYFMFSEEQAVEYQRDYGVSTSCLYKSGSFPTCFNNKDTGSPIRLVYAGRLYCNRWKTLSAIGEALRLINQGGIKMVLDIFTQENLTDKQRKALCEENYIYLKGAVTPEQLKMEYHKADIALHVESFDKSNRMATRYSFSTKIIDLMSSSCAILAICWEKHAGYAYLNKYDAAICISDVKDIFPVLQRIVEHPLLIKEYAQKAWNCGRQNHSKEIILRVIREKFYEIICQKRNR